MTNRRPRRRRAQAGFTIIELMISLVLFSFAVAGVLAVAVSMVNGFREQRLAVATEGAARSAMNYMADSLRGASPGVPSGTIVQTFSDGVDDTPNRPCGKGAIEVINSSTGPDELYAVFASGSVVTTSTSLYDAGSATLSVIDAEQISAGDTLLITNYAEGRLVEVTGVSGNDLTVMGVNCALASPFPSAGYPPGSVVIRAMRAHFFIDAPDGIPTLFVDPDAEGPAGSEPLAEGIEDMQIAIGIDQGTDGITELGAAGDDDEWVYNHASDTPATTEPNPMPLTGTIRALRITLIARAAGRVTGVGTFLRPGAEDRPGSAVADNFRRRVLTSVIEVRNLGGSP